MLCHVSSPQINLLASQDIILTWINTHLDLNNHHTKKEYLKIHADGTYKVAYEIKWQHTQVTTQPFQATIYRIRADYSIETLHQHVTVCVGNPITLKKDFTFELKAGERIAIGAKNFSSVDFILMNSQLSLTQV